MYVFHVLFLQNRQWVTWGCSVQLGWVLRSCPCALLLLVLGLPQGIISGTGHIFSTHTRQLIMVSSYVLGISLYSFIHTNIYKSTQYLQILLCNELPQNVAAYSKKHLLSHRFYVVFYFWLLSLSMFSRIIYVISMNSYKHEMLYCKHFRGWTILHCMEYHICLSIHQLIDIVNIWIACIFPSSQLH